MLDALGAVKSDYLHGKIIYHSLTVGPPQWRIQEFCSGGGVQQIQLMTERTRGSGGGSPLVRGSGGSCNLVQEISFHIVKFS